MRTGLVAASAAVLVLTAPPAGAEQWHARDARGDVATFSHVPGPPPCGTSTESTDPTDFRRDITRLAVDHGPEVVEVRVALREVRRRDRDTSWTVHLLVPRGAFGVSLVRVDEGLLPLMFPTPEPTNTADECGSVLVVTAARRCDDLDARLDVRRDGLVVSVPRTCLGDPRWVRVGATTSGGFSGSAESGFTVHEDAWAPPGETGTWAEPVLGPRVRRG